MTSKRIGIVTDSVCDVPPELIAQWGITVIPCFVNYDGNSYADDGVELDRAAFYRNMPAMKSWPTTAAPSPGLAEEKLRAALAEADHLVCIHVPGGLSATLNAVRLAAEKVDPQRITIVDSLQLSMGIGLQVLVAAEAAQQTGDVQQVLDAVERARLNIQLYAGIVTMEGLRRSGRVNAVVAGVGSLLQIKPIVRVWDGAVLPVARVRTMHKLMSSVRDYVRAEAPLERAVILHVYNEQGALQLRDELGDILPHDTMIVEVGPTLGVHIAPGAVGAATLSQKWRT